MNLPTEILINTEIREKATPPRHSTTNKSGISENKVSRTNFPFLVLSARLPVEQILKEKGTISVQNMARAVAVARA